MKVNLNSIQNIKRFVEICAKYPFNIIAKKGRYVVDAKSIMGMLSLDLSQPVQIEVIFKNNIGIDFATDRPSELVAGFELYPEQEKKLMELTEELEQFSKGV